MRHIINAKYIFRRYCSFCWDVLTVLVETLTFVGQWLRRVLDVAYLCWRASRTSALSSRPVVARLLPEHGRSFTSPGFSPCLLSILYTVLCDICIVWAMCDTLAPAASIPMTWHRWLMVLFPMTKSNWPVTKSWLLGGQSCVGFNCIVLRLYGQFHSFLPDLLPGIYTSYWQFFRKQLNV